MGWKRLKIKGITKEGGEKKKKLKIKGKEKMLNKQNGIKDNDDDKLSLEKRKKSKN